ncbi:uncharacterized protein LOC108323468 [Vigna angularis]|uniref:uncharacterized protein LOC108323468 n=1 Tax=Phaseolus angularis TaxID=3914 RepID=UPI00080A16A7|nr:uncharacterized protein LOC108323468 [Vigna angularis]
MELDPGEMASSILFFSLLSYLHGERSFIKITLTLILPLSFIFLIHIEVSNILFGKIVKNTQQMMETPQGTPQYHTLSNMLSSEWTTFMLFKLIYFTFLLIFSLLSTSAVVYTIASIYITREVTFSKVMTVVPKLEKTALGPQPTMYWSVVTVLEDSCGIGAMLKSNALIRGKTSLSVLIFLKLLVFFGLIQFLFKKTMVHGWRLGCVDRTLYGIVCLVLFSQLYLFQLVIQTVLYFVCKSYHHQNIKISIKVGTWQEMKRRKEKVQIRQRELTPFM